MCLEVECNMLKVPVIQLLLVICLINFHSQCAASDSQRHRFCDTDKPNESLKQAHKLFGAQEAEHQNGTAGTEGREVRAPIEIETWFHIVTSEADTNLVSDEMITTQLSYLQNAYEEAGIFYQLKGVTRQVNDAWARNEDEIGMKKALRKGKYSTLNVYFHSDLRSSSGGVGRSEFDVHNRASQASEQLSSSVLGFCTLPDSSVNATSSPDSYVKDGCNVLAKTMPGGPLDLYNRGGTAIHEIGHWNGLLHIFEGESCSPDNEGDYISDTPQQSEPTDGCPSHKNSCPAVAGSDAIHNFMDYSNDECYESFTPDQIKRMRSMWSAMREGK